MSFGVVGTAVAGAVAGNVVGGLFADDPSEGLQQSSREANALQLEMYNRDEARNQPLIDARDNSLGLLQRGLGITPLESKDQIRARLLAQRQGQSTQSQGLPTLQQVGSNSYIAPNANPNIDSQILDLQREIDQIYIDPGSSSNYADNQIEKERKLQERLSFLQAQQRIQTNYANYPASSSYNNVQQTNNDIEAQVEAEYALQQQQNANLEQGSLLRDFSMADFQADPGYEFRKGEALKALERSGAARGGALSGGALKAITEYSQNAAADEYQNAYNRFNNNKTTKYNFLSNLAQLGQVGANNLSTSGHNYANQVGNNITSTGSAIAQGQLYNNQLNQRNIMNSVNRGLAGGGGFNIPSWAGGGITYNNTNTGVFDPAFLGSGTSSYGDM